MKEQLVTLETAKLAKEKEFDWKCYRYYHDVGYSPVYYNPYDPEIKPSYVNHNLEALSISAPAQSLLQKWLRDVHNIHLVCWWLDTEDKFYTELGRKSKKQIIVQSGSDEKLFDSYEQALEAGLLEALKLI